MRAGAAQKHTRKNPLSVLVTMLAVGGMVAVAGSAGLRRVQQPAGGARGREDGCRVARPPRARNGHGAHRPPRRLHGHQPGGARRGIPRRHPRRSERGVPRERRPRSSATTTRGPTSSPTTRAAASAPSTTTTASASTSWPGASTATRATTRPRSSGSGRTSPPPAATRAQWRYAWESKGWPVSSTPIPGSVAYFNGNHVAYVKEVLDGGTHVLIEEYNHIPGAYGQRVLPVELDCGVPVPAFLIAGRVARSAYRDPWMPRLTFARLLNSLRRPL